MVVVGQGRGGGVGILQVMVWFTLSKPMLNLHSTIRWFRIIQACPYDSVWIEHLWIAKYYGTSYKLFRLSYLMGKKSRYYIISSIQILFLQLSMFVGITFYFCIK